MVPSLPFSVLEEVVLSKLNTTSNALFTSVTIAVRYLVIPGVVLIILSVVVIEKNVEVDSASTLFYDSWTE
ncbi:hypothetical protein TNCV_3375371 [Trichonephila clavipes]|nr:hypothetical protein TNCV_3375371 [Trichonephila clavipes]